MAKRERKEKKIPLLLDEKEKRKLLLKKRGEKNVWYGFGLFGAVGWSIVIPALIGLALGIYLDAHYPGPYLFSLMGFVLGLTLGCLLAYRWVQKEQRAIEKEREE